jgi:hypothetical protein
MRSVTALEGAIGFAIVGSILMVGVPAFVHELHASKQVEATSGIETMAALAVVYADGKPIEMAFPLSAPLTPAVVAKGTREVDPPNAWDHPTWKALGFRPVAEGAPHAYSFEFDPFLSVTRSTFRAVAHGDLDGDGTQSTFEVRGTADHDGARVEPGMMVDAELE